MTEGGPRIVLPCHERLLLSKAAAAAAWRIRSFGQHAVIGVGACSGCAWTAIATSVSVTRADSTRSGGSGIAPPTASISRPGRAGGFIVIVNADIAIGSEIEIKIEIKTEMTTQIK
jgi:hypothetical protein